MELCLDMSAKFCPPPSTAKRFIAVTEYFSVFFLLLFDMHINRFKIEKYDFREKIQNKTQSKIHIFTFQNILHFFSP